MAPAPPSAPSHGRVQAGRTPGFGRPASALDALLADLGSRIRRGSRVEEPPALLPTGIQQIDQLLHGGFPCGTLSEITGSGSSGRTSLALALLAATTRRGECVAVVDRADAFDPASAEAAGVQLDRVLWVRAPQWRQALRCTERLLETEGFPLVLLDAACALPQAGEADAREVLGGGRGAATWLRLARSAAAARAALILLTAGRLAGSPTSIVLEMQPARPRFSASPALLEALETRAALVRHRTAPIDRTVSLRLATRTAA